MGPRSNECDTKQARDGFACNTDLGPKNWLHDQLYQSNICAAELANGANYDSSAFFGK